MIAEEIFLKAIEQKTAAERAAYLDGACGNDAQLRAEVEELLVSDDRAGSFLEQPLFDESPNTVDHAPLSERPGAMIGRYKLLEQIGEGGFGVVFMAMQEHPVRRKVALKVIKPGMDTKEVIARFEAERQALALMDHPNIATVLDAGTTGSGRPYFVMELIRGVPITDFCDSNKLTTKERLRLFATVCHAVQHAHHKGIIHRDIKPSNILVTMHDDRAVPVIIDFGVAKATNSALTERTLFTRFAQMIGTPLYMSPEQAQMSGLDVDTRADIYSLGVLLYEMITGTTPFDQQRMREAAHDELLRIIREEEPPKPSMRISTLGETLPSVADLRRATPQKFSTIVRGELDWIVMKAMSKNRNERYESAGGLGRDVQSYLDDQPVDACPPSMAYAIRKFVRRHQGPFYSGIAVVAVLVLGIAGTTAALLYSIGKNDELMRAQRTVAEANSKLKSSNLELASTNSALERTQKELQELLLQEAIIQAMAMDEVSMNEKIRRARLLGASEAWQLKLQGLLDIFTGRYDEALAVLEEAAAQEPRNVAVRALLFTANSYAGNREERDRQYVTLIGLQASDDLDILLTAMVDSLFWDVEAATQQIEDLVGRQRAWELARVLLAWAKIRRAWETETWSEAAEAATEAAALRIRLPKLRLLHVIELQASLTMAVLAPISDEARRGWWERADAAALVLNEQFLDRSPVELAVYYYHAGEIEKALGMFSAGDPNANRTVRTEKFGQAMFCEQRRYEEMLAFSDDPWPLAALILETDLKEVELLCNEQLSGEHSDLSAEPIWGLLALGPIGRRDEAMARWRRILKDYADIPWNREFVLRIFTGEWNREEALARSGTSRARRLIVHFAFAMKALHMDGNREAAINHFQQCVDQGAINLSDHYWAKAFLKHFEDPAWPCWLPEVQRQ